jgi:hypothetical protein
VSHAGDLPLAVLWELEWNENRLVCAVYRRATDLELRVESAKAVIVSEPFVIEPRALARAQKLRDDLKRRGWSEGTSGVSDSPHGIPQPEGS